MSDGLKFFGCTVKSFSTSLGWGNQPSNVRVSLVQDVQGGDSFDPIPVGTPATVEYGSLHFTGLLRDWKRMDSDSGFPVYDVNLEDPRSILDGTEIILRDYNGSVYGVPNLINVYGYNENIGFGNAYANESGMPWQLIQSSIVTLVDGALVGTITAYGGLLSYKGFSYGIDLSQMPEVPQYYRIPGQNISLLRIIEQVCTDASCDFFIDFIPGTSIIRVRTVNRRLPPSLSVLSNFIDEQTLSGLCVSSSKGLEMRNEPSSAFITGGLQSTLFESTVNYQYWGQNILNQPIVTYYRNPKVTLGGGNVLISAVDDTVTLAGGSSATNDFYTGAYIVITAGTGRGQSRTITAYNGTTQVATVNDTWDTALDATSVYTIYTLEDPFGLKADLNCSEVADILGTNTYTCYISELLCALGDINRWESYCEAHRPEMADLFRGWTIPLLNQVGALQRGQFPADVLNLSAQFAQQAAANVRDGLSKWQSERIYNWLLSTANNHLGRTFLAQIPFMFSAVETDTLRVVYSHEPSNAGWVEGGPPGIPLEKQDLVETEDGRVSAYAKYFNKKTISATGTAQGVTFPTDVYLSAPASNNDNSYVGYFAEVVSGAGAGQVTSILGYTGATRTATVAPWVGVQPDTTSTIIVYRTVSSLDLTKVNRRKDVVINGTTVFVKAQVEQGKVYMLNGITPCALVTLSDALWELPSGPFGVDTSALATIFGHIPSTVTGTSTTGAGGAMRWNIAPPAVSPFSIQIPLQSNTLTYGPWYAIGAQGKVAYRSDSSLVPWNYGGSTVMDLTANAMVIDAISWANVVESGEVTLVGAPVISLGDAIQANGPACTSMDVYYGEDGIKTTYRFQTFSPKFGQFSYQNAQRLKTIGLAGQRISREIRTTAHDLRSTGVGIAEGTAFAYRQWNQLNNPFYTGRSPHPIIVADSQIDSRDTTLRRVEASLTSISEVGQSWAADEDGANSEFTSKGSCSLAAIFRPFHTRLVGVDSTNTAINLPDGIATYNDLQMPAYWAADSQANYHYAMMVTGSNSIDPFLAGNDVEILLSGDEYSDAHNQLTGSGNENDQRVVCLKTPLVLSGWGYSTDDSYVPALHPQSLTGGMDPDYLKKSHLWKTGPLEVLWDDERGVWTGLGICMGKTVGVCAANGGTTTLYLYEDATTEITGRKKARTVYNFMSRDVAANTKVICLFVPEKKGWVITAGDCS